MLTDPPLPVLVLVRDLIFSSRIAAEARALGISIQIIRDPAKLPQTPGRRLLVDLNLAGALDAAKSWRANSSSNVVGFVSHTDAETISAARRAGLDRVMPRSQFVEELPALLKG